MSNITNVMQNWSKPLGSKPSEANLALAHVFGRPGKQSLALAMALRDGGVTRKQMVQASALFNGKPTPHLNKMRELIDAKLFTRQPVPGAYVLVKGPKADQFIALHGAKAAEKVEAPKADKPKSAKAKVKAKVARKAKPAAETGKAEPAAAEMAPVPSEAVADNHATA